MTPLFSIVTITYNAARELPATLRSVAAQTFADFEYIVVDGGSSDGTAEMARGCGIAPLTVVSEPDNGLYDAMNKGMRLAKGDYLVFLNAGDAFHSSESLREIADAIGRVGHPDVVYGQTVIVDSARRYLSARHLSAPERLTFDSFKRGMLVCHQAFVARRDIAEPYDLRYRYSADYEWCLRCLRRARECAYTGTVLIDYLSDGLTDRHRWESLRERFRIMCRYYGTLPTIARHAGFLLRAFRRRLCGR